MATQTVQSCRLYRTYTCGGHLLCSLRIALPLRSLLPRMPADAFELDDTVSRELDVAQYSWTNLELTGHGPGARRGHHATAYGRKLLVLGGFVPGCASTSVTSDEEPASQRAQTEEKGLQPEGADTDERQDQVEVGTAMSRCIYSWMLLNAELCWRIRVKCEGPYQLLNQGTSTG